MSSFFGKLQFDKVNIADMIVIIALSIALFVAINSNLNELSMSIASGLLGYIGGSAKGIMHLERRSEEK